MKKISFIMVICILLSCFSSYSASGDISGTLSKTPFVKWDFYMGECEELEHSSSFEVIESEGASGGKALVSSNASDSTDGKRAPDILMKVNASNRGIYSLYIRARVEDANTNSLLYGIDDKEYTAYWQMEYGKYCWRRELLVVDEGEHIIKLASRRNNVKVDKIIFTNHPNYTTGELGFDCDPDADIFAEPEKLLLHYNMALPPYLPETPHPRVMVNKGDIERIKANLEHPQNKGAYNSILYDAQRDPSVCIMKPKGNALTNYSSASKSYIEANAFLYLVNEDREAGRKAIKGCLQLLRTLDNIGHTNTQQVSRQSGEALFVVAEAYDWCYDLMTPEERREIIERTVFQLMACEYCWPPKDTDFAFHHSHAVEIDFMKILLAVGISFYDEYPIFYNYIGGHIFNDFVPVKNYLWNNDVINVVGNGYHREESEMYMICLLDKIGLGELITEKWKDQLIGHLYTMLPSGGTVRLGDGNNSSIGNHFSIVKPMFMAGNYYNDPMLKRAAYEGNDYTYFITPVQHQLINNVNVDTASYKTLPYGLYSGNLSGTVITRTGWEKDLESDDVVVMMRTPQMFYGGHNHYDAGQFQIFYKGMLAMKSGTYSNMGTGHFQHYYKQTISSNCMLIYNPDNDVRYKYNYVYLMGGQSSLDPASFDWGSDLKNDSGRLSYVRGVDFGGGIQNPDFSYLKGDITPAYGGNADLYTRTFAFMNFKDEIYPGALIVMDKVCAEPSFKRTFLLHSTNEPEISGNKQTITRTDRGFSGRLINETLLPEKASIKKIGGEGNEFTVNGINYPDSVTFDSGSWRLEISPESNTKTDYFINVMQISDNDPSIKPLESKLYETDSHYGVKIKDRVAFLSKGEFRTARSLTVEADGEEAELIYMIDGVKAGTWSIKGENGEIAKAEATEDGGVISFRAAPGKYTASYWSTEFTRKPLSFAEVESEILKENEVTVKLNDAFAELKNPVVIREGAYLIPFEETMKRLNVSQFCKLEDGKIRISFFGKNKILDTASECETINGVLYVDSAKLSEVLTLSGSYNSISKILSLNIKTIMASADEIKNSADENRIRVKHIVTESSNPHLLMDNQTGTNYYYDKKGTWAMFEFEKEEELKDVEIYWGNAHLRSYNFKLETSLDGINWNTAFEGDSDGYVADFEKVKMKPQTARFVRVTGYGNTQNGMFSIQEIRFLR